MNNAQIQQSMQLQTIMQTIMQTIIQTIVNKNNTVLIFIQQYHHNVAMITCANDRNEFNKNNPSFHQ